MCASWSKFFKASSLTDILGSLRRAENKSSICNSSYSSRRVTERTWLGISRRDFWVKQVRVSNTVNKNALEGYNCKKLVHFWRACESNKNQITISFTCWAVSGVWCMCLKILINFNFVSREVSMPKYLDEHHYELLIIQPSTMEPNFPRIEAANTGETAHKASLAKIAASTSNWWWESKLSRTLGIKIRSSILQLLIPVMDVQFICNKCRHSPQCTVRWGSI